MTRQNLNLELLRIWTEKPATTLLVTHGITEAIFLVRPGRGDVAAARAGSRRSSRSTCRGRARPRCMRTPEFHALVDRASELLFGADGAPPRRPDDAPLRACPGWLAGLDRRRRPHRRCGGCSSVDGLPAAGGHHLHAGAVAVGGASRRSSRTASRAYWTRLPGDDHRGRDRLRLGQRHRPAAGGDRAAASPRIETVVTQIAVVSYCLPVVAVGGIAIVVLGGAKQPGDPSRDRDLPRRARCVLHDRRRRAARLQGGRQGRASTSCGSTAAARFTQLRKVRLDRGAAGDPQRPADRRADRVPRRRARRVHGRASTAGVGITLIRLQGDLDSARRVGGVPALRGRRAGRRTALVGLLVAPRHAVGLREGAG